MQRVENDVSRKTHLSKLLVLIGLAMNATNLAAASVDEDRGAVAALDTRYQAAVEKNDAETIARIHHDNIVLVLAYGTIQSCPPPTHVTLTTTIPHQHLF